MSSTNRGYDRHKSDYYVTPHKPIKDFITAFLIQEPDAIRGKNILDPCAGGDKHNVMSYPTVISKFSPNSIQTYDIRKDSLANKKVDYLKYNVKPNYYDVIFSNPPFCIAEDFIRKGLNDVKMGGFVIMLLRLNFFGSKKRKPLFIEYMPKYHFIHSERISFITTEKSKTDSIEYAHFVWQKGYTEDYSKGFLI